MYFIFFLDFPSISDLVQSFFKLMRFFFFACGLGSTGLRSRFHVWNYEVLILISAPQTIAMEFHVIKYIGLVF